MSQQESESFPSGVASKLKTYVYRLIDPRNGETFYIGKGRGNRVFAHIREKVEGDDLDNKLKRIREIHLAGFEVAHVIHRHGMDDKTAFEVEAALIDAYPGLTQRCRRNWQQRLRGHACEGDHHAIFGRTGRISPQSPVDKRQPKRRGDVALRSYSVRMEDQQVQGKASRDRPRNRAWFDCRCLRCHRLEGCNVRELPRPRSCTWAPWIHRARGSSGHQPTLCRKAHS